MEILLRALVFMIGAVWFAFHIFMGGEQLGTGSLAAALVHWLFLSPVGILIMWITFQ